MTMTFKAKNDDDPKLKMYRDRMEVLKKLNYSANIDINELQSAAFELGRNEYFHDHCLVKTIMANVDNDKLTDAEFRLFVRGCVNNA